MPRQADRQLVVSIVRRNAGKGHYYLIDGKKADGVTTLISDGLPKPALTRWAAKSVAEYVADNVDRMRDCYDWMDREQIIQMLKQVPWSERDTAAVRGTDVHELAEKLTHGEEVDVPDHLTGYVNACVKFLDEWQVRPVLTETVVASRQWGLCGTIDGVYDLADGRRVLSDFKTTASGIWPETALQLAAYANCEVYLDSEGKEQPIASLGIDGAVAVWIRSDGYDVIPVDISEPVWKTFLYVASVARWAKKQAKGCIGDPLTLPETVGAA
jgi:hypothetical protein